MYIKNGTAPGRAAPGFRRSTPKEKSAWLGAAETDLEEASVCSVSLEEKIINDEPQDFATMRALFNLRGYTVTRSRRVPCGRVSYHVSRWESRRTFGSLPELRDYCNKIKVAPL